jgi:putative holliday junction resolvase
MPEGRAPATVVAFDFGLRRVGVAVGDTVTRTASPRPVVLVSARGPDWDAIAREIGTVRPALLVVGSPYNADGSPGATAGAADAFAAELASRFGLPVQRVDERFSSLEASASLRAQRASGTRRRRVRRGDVDSVAAAVILERWLGGEGANG